MGVDSSGGVEDWALKFVKPEGLSHTVEGGTNGIGHGSKASRRSLSGTQSSVPKGGGEAGKGFGSLYSSELLEKRVVSDADLTEEPLVAAPAVIALGAG